MASYVVRRYQCLESDRQQRDVYRQIHPVVSFLHCTKSIRFHPWTSGSWRAPNRTVARAIEARMFQWVSDRMADTRSIDPSTMTVLPLEHSTPDMFDPCLLLVQLFNLRSSVTRDVSELMTQGKKEKKGWMISHDEFWAIDTVLPCFYASYHYDESYHSSMRPLCQTVRRFLAIIDRIKHAIETRRKWWRTILSSSVATILAAMVCRRMPVPR